MEKVIEIVYLHLYKLFLYFFIMLLIITPVRIIIGYNIAQPEKINIKTVVTNEIRLIINFFLLSLNNTTPAAHPARYVNMKVALGICIS